MNKYENLRKLFLDEAEKSIQKATELAGDSVFVEVVRQIKTPERAKTIALAVEEIIDELANNTELHKPQTEKLFAEMILAKDYLMSRWGFTWEDLQ
jgi:hypothetical protein